jgi:uncharacterized protein YbjT (DUF2867 family)
VRILVAGASGLIGRETVKVLAADGHAIRTFSRDPDRASSLRAIGAHDVRLGDATAVGAWDGACADIDVVVSALGASVSPSARGLRSYAAIDRDVNLALLKEAVSAGVRRFVYVGVHAEPAYADTAYVRAHREVEEAIRTSGMEHGFVRATGVHGTLLEMVDLAARGVLPVFGDGSALTNPIHQADVAAAVGSAVAAPGSTEVEVGGPEPLTRRRIAELAFAARGGRPRIVPVPVWVGKAAARAAGLIDRRLGEFLMFGVLVSTTSCVAPAAGDRTLRESFEAYARSR